MFFMYLQWNVNAAVNSGESLAGQTAAAAPSRRRQSKKQSLKEAFESESDAATIGMIGTGAFDAFFRLIFAYTRSTAELGNDNEAAIIENEDSAARSFTQGLYSSLSLDIGKKTCKVSLAVYLSSRRFTDYD